MDSTRAKDGHALATPKAIYPKIFEIAPEALAAASRPTVRVAKAVNAAVKPEGINLMQANGEGAGQSVGHFHLHIVPRRADDGLLFNWQPKPGDMAHIAEIAERIRGFLSQRRQPSTGPAQSLTSWPASPPRLRARRAGGAGGGGGVGGGRGATHRAGRRRP